jgi:methyl coenzyme M reductase subunit D
MLIAAGDKSVSSPPLELLCEAAGMRLEALLGASEPAKGPDLVQVTPARAEVVDPEDRKLHLQAQRMARVRVAEMRLYNERELREGAATGNIYASLKSVIDTARNQFLQGFLAKSSTMVDYLHLEILQNLAHGDDRLLGRQYPGPMV